MADPIQYVTVAEFQDWALPQEALRNMTTPTISRALLWASLTASGFIMKRKVLPLRVWGEDLRSIVCELAAYRLLSRKGYQPGSGGNDLIRESYDDALKMLENISKGLVELVGCEDSSITPTVDEAGPLMASDEIVDWRYQTRGSGCQVNRLRR